MSDDRIEAKLAAYVDGQLPPEEAAEVERHLAGNARHRRLVEEMLQAKHWMATLPRHRAPPDLLESIDPTLERSALFAEPPPASPWRTLISPQALALAATLALVVTLLAAMLWLMPGGDGTPTIVQGDPEQSDDGREADPLNVDDDPGPLAEGHRNDPDRPVDDDPGDDGQPQMPNGGALAEGGEDRPQVVPRLPANLEESILVSADVENVPQAGTAVLQFLTAQDLPIDAQRLPASALPEDLRRRLGVSEGQSLLVFNVEGMSLEQIGELTAELADSGSARATTPAQFIARHAPPRETTQPGDGAEEAMHIQGDDWIQLEIARSDDPPAEPPPGMPPIGRHEAVEIEVTADGYADFGRIGLGRMDVLGKLPAEVAAEIQSVLERNYQIPADVHASLSSRSSPQAGRTRQSVALVYLDREPLKAGDLVQIELPGGGWLHTVVGDDGTIDAGEFGSVEAAGKSAAEIGEALRKLASQNRASTQEGDVEATRPAPKPLRVVNLSARRAQGVDSWAEREASALIVLIAPAAEAGQPEEDPWAPLLGPTTQPATGD